MITSRFRHADGRVEQDLSRAGIEAALGEQGGLLWVDIDAGAGRDAGESLLRDVFRFHHLTIDDCYNALIDPPKVDDYGEYVFVIIHDVQYDGAARSLRTSELDMYIGANYVVSLHRFPVHAVQEVARRADNGALVLDRGAGFLAHALFDVVVDDFHPVVERLDDEVAVIEEQVLARPERDTLEQVLTIKRNVQRLKRSILPQRDVANRFARGEYVELAGQESLMYFRDVYDHTVRVEEIIETVRDVADGTLNTYLSSVNNRLNETMKTLAIATVIGMPLTIIAGIYGTNFGNVPEYEWRYGYPGMLIAMVVVVMALLAWFRYRRWI